MTSNSANRMQAHGRTEAGRSHDVARSLTDCGGEPRGADEMGDTNGPRVTPMDWRAEPKALGNELGTRQTMV